MRQQLGLISVCGAVTLLLALAIGLVYRSLPPDLAIAIIVLPSVVGACAGGFAWNASSDTKQQHALLAKDVIGLKQDVEALKGMLDFRLTQLLVATGDEQRAQGKVEGAASVAPVDAAVVATAAAAAVASVVASQADAAAAAAVIAKQVILDATKVAADVERARVASAAAAAAIAVNVTNGAIDARLENIEHNTAATVQAIQDNHL